MNRLDQLEQALEHLEFIDKEGADRNDPGVLRGVIISARECLRSALASQPQAQEGVERVPLHNSCFPLQFVPSESPEDRVTSFSGRMLDAEGRFISYIGTDLAEFIIRKLNAHPAAAKEDQK